MAKSLIIVESPAKARTLQKYLGKAYTVKASVGHVRDLPVSSLGVDVEHGFTPQYVTIKGKGKILSELRTAAKSAQAVYLAPDPDREGEAIAWHIAHSLKSLKKPLHRALFHELTKKAIENALANATKIDQHLFEAQQTRRILDRLVGYQISPLLWDKVRRGLSAGRVQSVAVRMICEREEAITAFKPEEYWSIAVALKAQQPPIITAQLDKINGKKAKISNEEQATALCRQLEKAAFHIADVARKQKRRNPSPPFITSTMQMDANRRLRFSAKKTMTLAQRLYEGIELGSEGPVGLITYMRTDSTRINKEAQQAAREYISTTFGKDYLPSRPPQYKAKKSAQDAHEAIRPTDVNRSPEQLAPFLEPDLLKLYTLIWKRFVASQMAPAIFDQTTLQIAAGTLQLKAVGSILRFPGFITLYSEAKEENGNNGSPDQATLPDVKKGEPLTCQGIDPKQHFTQPPPRYTEASLVKALEENGVGRPSTYAAIISTIQDKEYVRLEQRRFFPTELGILITRLLVEHFPAIMEVEFTASMEQKLDRIAMGKTDWRRVLEEFYGPFSTTLAAAKKEMKSIKRTATPTDVPCSQCGATMVIKWGRLGEFLACEKFPDCKNTQDFKRDADGTIRPIAKPEPEPTDEVCEKCGKPMVYRNGRFGRFLACSGYPDCKNIRATSTGVPCPNDGCDGEIIQKVSRRGKVFYSCNRYPKCRLALWDKPVNRTCPGCGAPYLLAKNTKRLGPHLKCADKKCGYQEQLPDGEESK